MKLCRRSHPDVAPPMTSPESTLGASQDPSFEAARIDKHDNMQMSALEAALNGESKRWSIEATAVANEAAPVEKRFVKSKTVAQARKT